MLEALNGMMLDMLAAIARKDYEDRRRTAHGIAKAKAEGLYAGCVSDKCDWALKLFLQNFQQTLGKHA